MTACHVCVFKCIACQKPFEHCFWNLQPSGEINVFIRKYIQCFRRQTCMLTSTPGLIPKLRALPINYIIGGRHKRRGTKDRLRSGVVQDAHLPCQLAWICSHLGDMPLKRYLKEFPERFNWEGKAHPTCVLHHFVSWIEGKGRKAHWTAASFPKLPECGHRVTSCLGIQLPFLPNRMDCTVS